MASSRNSYVMAWAGRYNQRRRQPGLAKSKIIPLKANYYKERNQGRRPKLGETVVKEMRKAKFPDNR